MDGKTLFIAGFNVAEDKVAEFEDWYVKTHVPDGLGIPHFTEVHRFEKYRRPLPETDSGPRFFNLYVIDSEANIADAWLSPQREAASQDFFRWADVLSDGVQGIYVPKGSTRKEQGT